MDIWVIFVFESLMYGLLNMLNVVIVKYLYK